MLVGFGLDCFYSWAIVFFCLGLLPIAFDSSTHYASAFMGMFGFVTVI
jgi:hypothetical protein